MLQKQLDFAGNIFSRKSDWFGKSLIYQAGSTGSAEIWRHWTWQTGGLSSQHPFAEVTSPFQTFSQGCFPDEHVKYNPTEMWNIPPG